MREKMFYTQKHWVRGLVLCALLATGFAAYGNPALATKSVPLPSTPAMVSSSFDADWSVIHDFIQAHSIMPSTLVEVQLKTETYLGICTWVCIGPGVGWPANNATAIGVITFDSEDSARKAAEMITNLANR
ncbi:MAG: hypothetical protein JSS66_02865 [Armatimonadetes bacterium]|nr:hypothetical protein [Armatimonadota bacterium]